MKKALVITVGVGLAASSWASGFASDDATRYSSKTAWTNPTVCTCPLEPASAARIGEVSTKASLVKSEAVGQVETVAIPTSVYNTKLAVRNERPSEVELAPLK
jgi:hypothetical protein